MPSEYEPNAHDSVPPASLLQGLTDATMAAMVRELVRSNAALVEVTSAIWVVACSQHPEIIDTLPYSDACPVPGPKCPTCQAGRDQARAYMREHPGKHIAVGLVTFEVL